ncbi:MAG: cytochrome c assembly protein, partial [Bacteroidetes bacterium]
MLYQGEHLLIGQLGHFFALLSFVASLIATVAYFKSANSIDEISKESWTKLARAAFIIEAFSVIAIFATLYLIIYNHYFEYNYAHQHSKRSLEVKYLLSCFWEGQEGSFMLWSFWHCVLGLILMRTARTWEAPVMTIVSFAQVFLASFLVGIYFLNAKVGSSPFVLIRNEFPNAPIFQDPDYLDKFIRDGNGLNPLLQNYWMVIHPPVLFLGFASTIVPFSFAIAGLWKKDIGGWTKPALP